nr:uncharacterized protein LOC116651126 [Drosophila virilis]
MKQLLRLINLFLLLVLVTSQKEDEPKKCPPGQELLGNRCVKFRILVSGNKESLTKVNGENKHVCLEGFIWLESKNACAQKPRVCTDELCKSNTNSAVPKECPPNRRWNKELQKCVPKKLVTAFGNTTAKANANKTTS